MPISRRHVLQSAVGVPLTALAASRTDAEESRRSNRILEENAKPGARDWQLSRIKLDGSSIRSPFIEGYCSKQSVLPGESIDIMVSAAPACDFKLEIFRMGYYGGRGARLVHTVDSLKAETQPTPTPAQDPTRLLECKWKPTCTLTIPQDWISGVYLGRLSRHPLPDGREPWQSYVVFIVREDRPSEVLFQCSDNTWQAYNRWPTKYSLYDDGKNDWYSGPNVQVSFDRPYGKYRQIYENPQSVGSGEFLCWEFPMVYWLEQQGYDVTYCSNSDLLTPDLGLKSKCFISVGHDEYWDVRQYHSVKKMIDEGVNALFLCGNTLCWVTPTTPSTDGRPNRVITREAPYAGYSGSDEMSKLFKTAGPDEGLVMGVRNIVPVNGGGDWICLKPEHWLFEGTGMVQGEAIPGLVGWEFHGNPADLPGLEVIAGGTALNGGVNPQQWCASIHPGPKGNFVFNASTIYWGLGLSNPPGQMLPWSHGARPHGADDRVQQITQNLLTRATGQKPAGSN